MARSRNPEGAREVVPCRLLPKLKQALGVRAREGGKTVSGYLEDLVERDLSALNGQLQHSPVTTEQQMWPIPVQGPEEGPKQEVPEEGPPD